MKIGIVVYSWSGHTRSVGQGLKGLLVTAGHDADLVEIPLVGERAKGAREFEFGLLPDLSAYEGIVFGAAVEAFSLSPVMIAYLKEIKSLAAKSVACLVTQQFPFPWMGGNRAIRQMRKLCEAKGAVIVGAAVVNWAKSRREKTLAAALDRLSRLFQR